MKPEASFAFKNKSTGIRASWCKDCHKAYSRELYKADPGYHVQKSREKKTRMQEYLREVKSAPCTDCGKTFPWYCMDFDHLGDKQYNVSRLVAHGSWRRLLAEIEKCELVCSNCHRIRTYLRAHAGVVE